MNVVTSVVVNVVAVKIINKYIKVKAIYPLFQQWNIVFSLNIFRKVLL